MVPLFECGRAIGGPASALGQPSEPASSVVSLAVETARKVSSSESDSSGTAAWRRLLWYARPVPAGMRRPTITFSFRPRKVSRVPRTAASRSEEHTSELQSRENLVPRLLPERKNLDRHRPDRH